MLGIVEGFYWIDKMGIGWVCGGGISGWTFETYFLGYFYRIFLGQVNGCELRSPYRFFWGILDGTLLGDLKSYSLRTLDGEALG